MTMLNKKTKTCFQIKLGLLVIIVEAESLELINSWLNVVKCLAVYESRISLILFTSLNGLTYFPTPT